MITRTVTDLTASFDRQQQWLTGMGFHSISWSDVREFGRAPLFRVRAERNGEFYEFEARGEVGAFLEQLEKTGLQEVYDEVPWVWKKKREREAIRLEREAERERTAKLELRRKKKEDARRTAIISELRTCRLIPSAVLQDVAVLASDISGLADALVTSLRLNEDVKKPEPSPDIDIGAACQFCLTPRESRVLELRAQGKDWAEVVREYWPGVSSVTVGQLEGIQGYERRGRMRLGLNTPARYRASLERARQTEAEALGELRAKLEDQPIDFGTDEVDEFEEEDGD